MTTMTATHTGQLTAALATATALQLRAFVLAVRAAPLRPWMAETALSLAATTEGPRTAACRAAVEALIVAEERISHDALGPDTHATATLTARDAAVYGPDDTDAIREADEAVKAAATATLAVDTGALTPSQVHTILGTLDALTGADNA
jgi:hypothetical protein